MVSYQTMIAIAFDVAKQQGATFDGIDDGGQFIADLADVWQANKQQLKQATEQQTYRILEQIVGP
jgi:hypothetical protein